MGRKKSVSEQVSEITEDMVIEPNTHLEQILEVVEKSLTELLDEYTESFMPDICTDIIECKELCEKLMYYDYFKESEEYLDKNVDNGKLGNGFDQFEKVCNKWDKMQKRELKVKIKDLKRFSKLVIECFKETDEI